jgi:hypothetical protein
VLQRLDRKVFHNHKTFLRGTVPFVLCDPELNAADRNAGSSSVAAGASASASTGASVGGAGASGESAPTPDAKELHIDIRCNVTFNGDCKLVFWDFEKSGADQKMCWLYLNPNFIVQNYRCLSKEQIEGAGKLSAPPSLLSAVVVLT